MTGLNGLERIMVCFSQILNYLLSALVFGIFSILLLQVLYRYVFSLPLYWVEELAKYMMIYITMVGAAIAYRKEGHPRLSMIYHAIGRPGVIWYELVLRIPVAVFLIVLITVGLGYAETNSWIKSPGLQISFYWPFMSIPIGASCVLFLLVLDSIDILLFRRSWLMDVNMPAHPQKTNNSDEDLPQ